ncbi:MAG: hypothetical protein C0471_08210 [Erythrobacter sp.]|nr:hypothetical protein [Erythrobacter sp.]
MSNQNLHDAALCETVEMALSKAAKFARTEAVLGHDGNGIGKRLTKLPDRLDARLIDNFAAYRPT